MPSCAALRLIPAHAGKTICVGYCDQGPRAHPRSRGENLGVPCRFRDIAGSSPLTRGKPSDYRAGRRRRGLIPAHAGKTGGDHSGLLHGWAHPRSRGENALARTCAASVVGSSPLTRGKHRKSSHRCRARGLIPAHAGKTCPAANASISERAHPRSRGENRYTRVRWLWRLGSSPLTRGKRPPRQRRPRGPGLIPAHAGKTSSLNVSSYSPWAHPRSRGENEWPVVSPVI